MRTPLLLAVLCAVAVAPAGATAQEVAPRAPLTPVERVVPVKRYRQAVKKVYCYSSRDGNFRACRVTEKQRRKLDDMRRHAKNKRSWRAMLRVHRQIRRAHRFHHRIDVLTPYGKWAIPPAIVNCESASSGYWRASNPSGAVGPYQLLGWGAPFPVVTERQMAEHHVIASGLYRSQGAGPWTASRHCWG